MNSSNLVIEVRKQTDARPKVSKKSPLKREQKADEKETEKLNKITQAVQEILPPKDVDFIKTKAISCPDELINVANLITALA